MAQQPILLSVVGIFTDVGYTRCCEVAQTLASEFVTITVETSGLTETDYEEWCKAKSKEIGGDAYDHNSSPMVLYNGCNYIGDTTAFFAWARRVYDIKINSTYLQDALMGTTPQNNSFVRHPNTDDRHSFVEMEVTYGESKEETVGTVRIELYEELCPNGCANFKALCNGKNGNNATYVGSPFHRVVKGGYVQGGDNVEGHGDAGKSASGEVVPDESFTLSHGQTGIVSMSNDGPHTNASQFFVTLKPLPFLDTKFQAVGRVVSGMKHFRGIEGMKLENQRPVGNCIISAASIVSEPNGASVGSKDEGKGSE